MKERRERHIRASTIAVNDFTMFSNISSIMSSGIDSTALFHCSRSFTHSDHDFGIESISGEEYFAWIKLITISRSTSNVGEVSESQKYAYGKAEGFQSSSLSLSGTGCLPLLSEETCRLRF